MKYGAAVKAYYIKSAFQPHFELGDVLKLAEHLNADIEVIRVDILSEPIITQNSADRCYHCKKVIFSKIAEAAGADGFKLLIDGTNASDNETDRPGFRVLKELFVRSPLRESGLTKLEIRKLSKEAGLFTWDKPSYSCLATRIPIGTEINIENLTKTEAAEDYLFSLGFCDFRVRIFEGAAKIQVPALQFQKVMENRAKITAELKRYYSAVLLDLEERE